MNNWKGILRIKITDKVSEVGIKQMAQGCTTMILPSTKIRSGELTLRLLHSRFPMPTVLGMAYAMAGMQHDKLFIEEGDYTEEFYRDFLPYIMGRIQGKVMLPNTMLWKLMHKDLD